MTELPKEIIVLGKVVHIKVVPVINKDETTLGEWVGTENTIYIKQGIPSVGEVFLHELVECIKDKCDLQMNHTIICVLSEVLYQVIKTNDFGGIFSC